MIFEHTHLLSSLEWRASLLHWYDTHKRDFPWRQHVSPYWTWVCEVMSQQTTLGVVVPRFNEFVKKLPTVSHLASASDETLRSLWAGLGYYARARNLRSGAQYIVSQLHGSFPQTYDEWLKVPGVGPYTASVIVSICFGLPKACVDGNVIRVVSRLSATTSPDVWSESGRTKIQRFADAVIDPVRAGDFNQAMMELGAVVCKKQNPDCRGCPVRGVCRASQHMLVESCPPNKPRKEFLQVKLLALVFSSGVEVDAGAENFLLTERQRGFLSGTLGFPLIQIEDKAELERIQYGLKQFTDVVTVRLHEPSVRHTITRHKLEVGLIHVVMKQHATLPDLVLGKLIQSLGVKLSTTTWVSKNLVSENVSSALDLKVWEKIS